MYPSIKMAWKLRMVAVAAVIFASMTSGVTTAGADDSSNTVVKGIMYVGSDDVDVDHHNGIVALNAENGLILWVTYTTGVDWSPTVVKDVVYVDTDAGWVYALKAKTGEILWDTEINPTP